MATTVTLKKTKFANSSSGYVYRHQKNSKKWSPPKQEQKISKKAIQGKRIARRSSFWHEANNTKYSEICVYKYDLNGDYQSVEKTYFIRVGSTPWDTTSAFTKSPDDANVVIETQHNFWTDIKIKNITTNVNKRSLCIKTDLSDPYYGAGNSLLFEPATTSGFKVADLLTHSEIISLTNPEDFSIYYGTDTNDLYVFDGSKWQVYNND